jgi:hypothetical protein
MEFRLTYKGALPAQSGKGDSRISEKHSIRRQIHPQLKELWHSEPPLRQYTVESGLTKEIYAPNAAGEKITRADHLAHGSYAKFGYNFLPLVSGYFGLTCSLDILFLRRAAPGHLIESGGDIDNRMKVLLDGLRVPRDQQECRESPQDGENPFFCLLEDDSLITKISITTDRLLSPLDKEEKNTMCIS